MAWTNLRRKRVRGAQRRLRRWATTDDGPYPSTLEERGWDWWPVAQHPWSAMPPPRPSAKALRTVVETFAARLPAWEAFGERWHAAHPHATPPVASLYVRPDDLYRSELGLMVGDRAAAFWRDWHADDRPDAPLPSVLAAAAPRLAWRAVWVWEAWTDEDLDVFSVSQRRRLTRHGPGVPSVHAPAYTAYRAAVAWVGVRPSAVSGAPA